MELASSNSRESHVPPEIKKINSPAVRALLIQVASLAVCVTLAFASKHLLGYLIPFFVLLALQSTASLSLAYVCGLDWWWCVIEFFFPVAVVFALYIRLPPIISLLLFFVLFLIFGSTFRTRVPYYPSEATLPAAILELLPDEQDVKFLDVGSGFGGLLFDLSKARPQWSVAGVEIAMFPWLVSVALGKFYDIKNLKFSPGKYEDLDFSKFNVVFSYLSPVVMSEIWMKVQNEMSPGTLFLSYEFCVPDVPAFAEIQTAENAPVLYVWKI
ncbi:class I SAM-dependent methyltransferase [Undibacterium jejuense]|uniref:Class I SAM-dependent methyltransferase n=1 Tax=Undibacterium jejuense TaxID=1344949 RepID=A0A923HDC0_9BURK|nr:class I SAM-dependent methyltransferase [Undibacterium jejuense]MBC3861654.1 class I SAM-dependent methyltransferase [Undibacterium jejuense]